MGLSGPLIFDNAWFSYYHKPTILGSEPLKEKGQCFWQCLVFVLPQTYNSWQRTPQRKRSMFLKHYHINSYHHSCRWLVVAKHIIKIYHTTSHNIQLSESSYTMAICDMKLGNLEISPTPQHAPPATKALRRDTLHRSSPAPWPRTTRFPGATSRSRLRGRGPGGAGRCHNDLVGESLMNRLVLVQDWGTYFNVAS